MFKRKTSLLLLLLVVTITAMIPLNVYAINKDYIGHWAENTIQTWLDNNFVMGYPDGSFKPDGTVTRAEFVKMVNNFLGYTETTNISFTDIKPNDWFYVEIQKAFKADYIAGISETQFAPNNYLTREQASVIISKILNLDLSSEKVQMFSDYSLISDWARSYVNATAEAKLILGYAEDNSFRPQKPITRAEAIVLLDRMNQYEINDIAIPEGTITQPPTGEGAGGGGAPGPVDPTPGTIDLDIKNSIVMIGIEEEYNLADNLILEIPEVTLTYTIVNNNEIIINSLNGLITGKNQGAVKVTIKASKTGYENKEISFKLIVAPVEINWDYDTDAIENKLAGQEQNIEIEIGLLEDVKLVENVDIIMLWEKQADSQWKAVEEEDISITCESNSIGMVNGIYQLVKGMNVDNETTIQAKITFNEVGEYKLTIYCIKGELR